MKTALAVLLLSAAVFAQNSEEGKVVRYELKTSELKYTYAASYSPVAHLKSGNILETNTVDCFGNAIKKPGDTLSMAPGDNPLTGPFFIDGAEPGDTLAVKFLEIKVDGNQGIGALAPGFGAINSTNYTPMLNEPIKEKIWFYPIDHATNTATFQALDSKFSVKFRCIRSLAALESLLPAAKRAPQWFRKPLAATWTRPRPVLATRFISP